MATVQPFPNPQASQPGQSNSPQAPRRRTIYYPKSQVPKVPSQPEVKPKRSLKEWLLGSSDDSYERGSVKDWYRTKRRVGQEKLLQAALVSTAESATQAGRALQENANETDEDSLEGQIAEALAAADGHFIVESHQAFNHTHRERFLDDLAQF